MDTAAFVQQSVYGVINNAHHIFPAENNLQNNFDYLSIANQMLKPLNEVGINHTLSTQHLLQYAEKVKDMEVKGRIYLAIEAIALAKKHSIDPQVLAQSPLRKDVQIIVNGLKPLRVKQDTHSKLLIDASLIRVAQISGRAAVPANFSSYCSDLLNGNKSTLNDTEKSCVKALINYLYDKARVTTDTVTMQVIQTGKLESLSKESVCLELKRDIELQLMLFDTKRITEIIGATSKELNTSATFRGKPVDGELRDITQYLQNWREQLPVGDVAAQHDVALRTAEAHLRNARQLAEKGTLSFPPAFQEYSNIRGQLLFIANRTRSDQIQEIIAQGISQIDRLVEFE